MNSLGSRNLLYRSFYTRHVFCLQIPNLTLIISYSICCMCLYYKIHPLPQFTRLLLLQLWLLLVSLITYINKSEKGLPYLYQSHFSMAAGGQNISGRHRFIIYAASLSNSAYGSSICSMNSYGVTTFKSPETTLANMFAEAPLTSFTPFSF